MLTALSSPTSAPFWVTNATLVGLANWLTPVDAADLAEVERDDARAAPPAAAHWMSTGVPATPETTGVSAADCSEPSPAKVTVPEASRPLGCVPASTSAGRRRDLDRPGVGRAVAQERQGQVVGPAEAVVDLHLAGEGRLHAGGAAGGLVRR